MRRISPVLGIVLVVAIGFTVGARAQPDNLQAPDVIFVQGKIVTVDSNFEVVEAVAVKEGRIVAIGKNEQIRSLASAATRVVDLGGKTVLPGFNDNHIHITTGAGRGEDWKAISSLEALSEALMKKAGTRCQPVSGFEPS